MTRHQTALALAVFAATAILGVLARPLLPIDETRYLAVAWEMRIDRSFLVPHLNGALYADKPPLLFWLINLVWAISGVSETAARLVAPAFGLGTVAATSLLGRRLWPDDPLVGGRAAVILAGFGSFAVFAGLTMFDAMLALAVVLGLLALLWARSSLWGWVAFGVALALGGFSKGPVILIHLLPVALLMPLWSDARWGRTLGGAGLAILVGLAIIALWLVPALAVGGPDYRNAVLWEQHAGRVTESFAHERPWWYFLAILPLLLWPWAWSPGLLRALPRLDPRGDRGLRLCLIWAGATLLLFSLISGKQTHYLLPTLAAAALIFARALGAERFAGLRALLAAAVPAMAGLGMIAAAAGLYPVGRIENLAAPAWAAALAGLSLLAVAAVALLRLRGSGLVFLASGTLLVASILFAFGAPGRVYSPDPMATLLAPHDSGGVAIAGSAYHGEFSFAARLTRPVVELANRAEAEAWLAANPDGVVIARADRDDGPATPPTTVVTFRDRPYGVWGPTR